MKTKLRDKRLKSVVMDSVRSPIWGFAYNSVWDSVGMSVKNSVRDYVWNFVRWTVVDSVEVSGWWRVVNSVKRKCLKKTPTSNENKT